MRRIALLGLLMGLSGCYYSGPVMYTPVYPGYPVPQVTYSTPVYVTPTTVGTTVYATPVRQVIVPATPVYSAYPVYRPYRPVVYYP